MSQATYSDLAYTYGSLLITYDGTILSPISDISVITLTTVLNKSVSLTTIINKTVNLTTYIP